MEEKLSKPWLMSPDSLALYEKIQAFSLDAIDAIYSLSGRLVRQNRWSLAYTQRTIEEYKKFVLLAMITGHPVTPSEQVDQVWHLHLTYSYSYWEEFCPKVLGRSLHHGPTKGGAQEELKHRDQYRKTLEAYERTFGYAAPSDIWPMSDRRFGIDTQVQRVNVKQNWVIPKPTLPNIFSNSFNRSHSRPKMGRSWQLAGLAIGLAVGTSGCTVVNPLEMRGPEFLVLYFILGILGLMVGPLYYWWGRRGPEESGTFIQNLNPYELAYVNGGKTRVVDLAVTSLVKSNVIAINADADPHWTTDLSPWTVLSPRPDVQLDPIEQQILSSIQSGMPLKELRRKDYSLIEELRLQLQRSGFITSDATIKEMQWINSLLMSGLSGLGILRLVLGMMNGLAVSFLIIVMIIIFVIAGIGLRITHHRTRKGDDAVEIAKARYAPHIKFTSSSIVGLEGQVLLSAFAIYGGTVLIGDPALATLGNMIEQPFWSSSGDGGGGGCGGGFDGGGGCGGGCGGGGCGGG